MVSWCLICNKTHSEFQILEVNCDPMTDVMVAGTPKTCGYTLKIMPPRPLPRRCLLGEGPPSSDSSNQQQLKCDCIYLKVLGGSPVRCGCGRKGVAEWRWAAQRSASGPAHGDAFFFVGRPCSVYSLIQAVTSLFRPGQTNLEEISTSRDKIPKNLFSKSLKGLGVLCKL